MTAPRFAIAAAGLAVVAAVSGCSRAGDPPPPAASAAPGSPVSTATTTTTTTATSSTPRPAPAGMVGRGCSGYQDKVPTGPGSLDGMGRDPVASALANSPMLTTFAGALAGNLNPEVNLVDVINKDQYTVFVPTDDAFGRVDPATVDKLKTDSALLKSMLNYHIVPGQTDLDSLAGEHKSLQGGTLTVTGSGDGLQVNNAGLVCGPLRTANSTVYLIDTVLMPPPPTPTTTQETSPTTATP